MQTWWQRKLINLGPLSLFFLPLITALLFLLWAVAGWAEQRQCSISERDGAAYIQVVIPCAEFDKRFSIPTGPNTIEMLEDTVEVQCLKKMEQAMRAMEPYRDERQYVTVTDATNTIVFSDREFYFDPWPDHSQSQYSPPPPKTLDQQIDDIERKAVEDVRDLKRRYAKGQEEAGQHIVDRAKLAWAFAEWERAKQECWRQP